MTDDDITKLVAKLIVSLATKADIKRLEKKIDDLDKKADTILEHSEAVDEGVDKHEKRLRNIERIPIIANELKKPKF